MMIGLQDGLIEKHSRLGSPLRKAEGGSAAATRRSLTKAIEILKRHGATRIVLFGSSCSDALRPRSDVDLAVEGIPRGAWMRAYADVLMAVDRPVDMKPLEEIEAGFRDKILQEGVILHARSRSVAGPGC